MLQNASSLAIVAVHAAENELSEVRAALENLVLREVRERTRDQGAGHAGVARAGSHLAASVTGHQIIYDLTLCQQCFIFLHHSLFTPNSPPIADTKIVLRALSTDSYISSASQPCFWGTSRGDPRAVSESEFVAESRSDCGGRRTFSFFFFPPHPFRSPLSAVSPSGPFGHTLFLDLPEARSQL